MKASPPFLFFRPFFPNPLRRRAGRVAGTRGLAQSSTYIVLLAAGLMLLGTQLVAQPYRVEGHCMEPRLRTGQRVLGERWTYQYRAPRRGDIVIFRYPLAPSQLYIKRIVALGGETVEIRAGRVYVNHLPLSEPYLCAPGHDNWGPHRVRDDHYFVLGDHRDASDDSRHWGDVDRDALVAHAWLR